MKERVLPKEMMITNKYGISFYQKGNKYYLSTGCLEREISYKMFENEVKKAKAQIEVNA